VLSKVVSDEKFILSQIEGSSTRGTKDMNITVKVNDPLKTEADIVVALVWKAEKGDDVVFSAEAKKLDSALGGALSKAIKTEGFVGEAGQTFVLYSNGAIAANRVMIVAAQSAAAPTTAILHKTFAAVGKRALASKAKTIALALPQQIAASSAFEQLVRAAVTGMVLGTYQFSKHKTVGKEKMHGIETCVLLTTPGKLNHVTALVKNAQTIADGVMLSRDIVNEPPSTMTPAHLADIAKDLAKGQKTVSCEIFGKPELEKMGMGGLLGIARGSDKEPKFIKLQYKGGGNNTIALIGKGITFDSGGLSIKPAQGMETMKMDMAGAAAILGVFSALPKLGFKVNVVGLIAATENMLGPDAVKPGDVVTAMNGKTIEILNTDAEGRVVLSDALSYAVAKVRPDVMIDLATLTGACVVALGEDVAGLFASHQALADSLLTAAESTGEALWQMPLVDDYREMIKSKVADIKNIGGGRWGGAITAALFLQEFTDESIPWAHMDIAGPAFAERETPLTSHGATGYGVRMLISYLQKV
jgi:leucyl aminopeptidase